MQLTPSDLVSLSDKNEPMFFTFTFTNDKASNFHINGTTMYKNKEDIAPQALFVYPKF